MPRVDEREQRVQRPRSTDGAPTWLVVLIVFGLMGFGGPVMAMLLWWIL